MRVPAHIYASEEILNDIKADRSLTQLTNAAMLPGVVKHVIAMPDIHEGYGLPVGGVMATILPNGIISPGAIGYDINCGVRLLTAPVSVDEVRPHLEQFAHQLMRAVPSGTGRGGRITLTTTELEGALRYGAAWCVEHNFGTQEDLAHSEEEGVVAAADPNTVSDRAKKRGKDQLGTLGSGNHFLEVQRVDHTFDKNAASTFGLFPGQLAIAIHCGSRGLGHQVCTEYVARMLERQDKYDFELPDRELACAPSNTIEGQEYLAAMAAAANFAFANRQVITHHVRLEWNRLIGSRFPLRVLYDVAHNIAKRERYTVNGKEHEVLVHRKGATRAFPAGHPQLPEDFRGVGQPVLIPGTMGTASYVLCGASAAMEETFGTVCHGAGRRLSRHAAKKTISSKELRTRLETKGIIVKCHSSAGLVEEAPEAYKDVESVVNVVEAAGLSKKVARLRPVAVIKGE